MLKRDFQDRSSGQGPAAKRRDSSGTPGRSVYKMLLQFCFVVLFCVSFSVFTGLILTDPMNDALEKLASTLCGFLFSFIVSLLWISLICRLWGRVVTTRTSQDRNHSSSRLDSEGEEEEEEDTDKVKNETK